LILRNSVLCSWSSGQDDWQSADKLRVRFLMRKVIF
jgi:hypothetical protein